MKTIEKVLRERTEIAKAMNFKNDYTVIEMDVANEIKFGDEVVGYRGCLVNQDFGDEYYHKAQLNYFKDEKKLVISSTGACVSASFGFSDIKEMLEYRNAPVIKNGGKVIFVAYNSKTRQTLQPVVFEVSGLKKFVTGCSILDDASFIEALEA